MIPAPSWPPTIGKRTGASPWVMWSSEWHRPEALNLTRTSWAFGSSSCRSVSSQPMCGPRAMAAWVVMLIGVPLQWVPGGVAAGLTCCGPAGGVRGDAGPVGARCRPGLWAPAGRRSGTSGGAAEGDGLDHGVVQNGVGAHRAAEAAALVAAERSADDPGAQRRVHRHLAGLQALGELDRLADALGPDRGDQAVV